MALHEVTSEAIAQSYDAIPYDSRPFPQSHPARSAALGKLFGLNPPNIETARVLELGCAAAGNLIPLAASYPEATFVGIDLSPVQIARGKERVGELGLTNINLLNQSILDVSKGYGVFDYVICHGVYSWVPTAVQDAIFRIARENLSETGIAYVSYNVFPGWRLRGVLRDAMLFHCDGMKDGTERIAAARSFLNELAQITDEAGAYGQMLRQEAQALAHHEDYYIQHEYLEHTNTPCYVHEFIASAQKAGLAFLTEATLSITIAETFGLEKGKRLRELSGNRLDRMEQYIDFLTGRTFRQSLLVRETQAGKINRTLDPQRLDGLHLQTQLVLTDTNEKGFTLRDPSGRTLQTQSPFVRDCLLKLSESFPQSMTVGTLAEATADGRARTADENYALNDALFKMVLTGMIEVTSVPLAAAAVSTRLPAATLIARTDAARGKAWTTNQRHETVPLSVVQQAVLPMLDGKLDTDALAAALRDKALEGAIVFQRDGQPLTERGDIDAASEEHLRHVLAALTKSALNAA